MVTVSDNSNVNVLIKTIELTIEQADSEFITPPIIHTFANYTLNDVVIPSSDYGEWEFVDDLNTTVGESGNNTFKVYYIPYDTNYKSVLGEITLIVCESEEVHNSSLENGVYKCCGIYEEPNYNTETNQYEILNAGNLLWFAREINNGNIAKDVNAILLNDIDLEGYDWTPITSTGIYYNNNYKDGNYGIVETGYSGIFDGNNHLIKNIKVTAISKEIWTYGLFGTMTGTVKNLGIEGFTYNHNSASDMRTGAIVGQNLGGTIENCFVVNATINPGVNVAGGIAGCNYAGTIRNCFVYDSVIVGSSNRYGYITGDNRADTEGDRIGTIKNCYTNGIVLVGQYTGNIIDSKSSINYKSFENGSITWYLNNESINGVWRQGEKYPHFLGEEITESILSKYDEPAILDGVYQISTKSELFWFAEYVNFINADIDAVLIANIDLENEDWVPIGTPGNPYSGVFDGRGYEIFNFKMTITNEARSGLFGEISNATIKNFIIKGNVIVNFSSMKTLFYGVIGVSTNSFITDIHSEVNLKILDNFDKNSIAGIVGTITTTTIERCSFSGTLDLDNAYVDCVGGIIAYANYNNVHLIRDCAFYGKIFSNCTNEEKESSGQIGGIIGYYRGSNISIKNCISVGEIVVEKPIYTGLLGGRILQMGNKVSNISNNYYLGILPAFANLDNYSDSNAKNVEDFTTGEITYLLNGDQTNIVWYQTIGEDFPRHKGNQVYYGYISCATDAIKVYTNEAKASNEILKHSHENGICPICGDTIAAIIMIEEVEHYYLTLQEAFDVANSIEENITVTAVNSSDEEIEIPSNVTFKVIDEKEDLTFAIKINNGVIESGTFVNDLVNKGVINGGTYEACLENEVF